MTGRPSPDDRHRQTLTAADFIEQPANALKIDGLWGGVVMKRLIEVAFFVKDLEGVVQFYEKFLGGKVSRYEQGHAAEFSVDGVKLFIHKYDPDHNFPLPDVDHIAFSVDNLDRECDKLVAEGIVVEHAPRTYPWGRSALLRDPDGNWLELYEVKSTSR